MTRTLLRLLKDESGATAIEYGLIAACIAVARSMACVAFGTSLSDIFNYISGRATNVWDHAGT